jgi:hypothetical protein
MNQTQIETVGKVFVVVRGMRQCLICESMFTPQQAAEHATAPCSPKSDSPPDPSRAVCLDELLHTFPTCQT